MRNPINAIIRFEKKYKITESGCWLWTASKSKKGYGHFGQKQAHRASWEIYKGDIGKFHVLHKCDIRSCVNPDHLFLGTQKDNTQDMVNKNRHIKGSRVSTAKLNKGAVLFIRKNYEKGSRFRKTRYNTVQLAKKFNVTPGCISDVLDGITWKHI